MVKKCGVSRYRRSEEEEEEEERKGGGGVQMLAWTSNEPYDGF